MQVLKSYADGRKINSELRLMFEIMWIWYIYTVFGWLAVKIHFQCLEVKIDCNHLF